jgi:hypothetical protein
MERVMRMGCQNTKWEGAMGSQLGWETSGVHREAWRETKDDGKGNGNMLTSGLTCKK